MGNYYVQNLLERLPSCYERIETLFSQLPILMTKLLITSILFVFALKFFSLLKKMGLNEDSTCPFLMKIMKTLYLI